jgi:predicted dehydrogenase
VERIRIGVIGAGLVAEVVHLPLLRALDDRFAVIALADPEPERRALAGRRFAIQAVHADHRALIDAEPLDAVLVCSPNGTHAAVVLDALDAGLHVLVEKPLCITSADAERIAAARDRARRVVQVGYMKRFDPAFEALLADLPAGLVLDHVATTTWDPALAHYFGGVPAARRAPDPLTTAQVVEAVGTEQPEHVSAFSDAFLGALVHDVNAVHGTLERLGAATPVRAIDAACMGGGRVVTGVAALPGGGRWAMAWMLLAGLGEFRERIELFAADGIRSLEFPAPYVLHAPTRYRRSAGGDGGHLTRTFGSWREPYRLQLEHFHACVTAGAACRTPPEQARADIELLSRLFEAYLESVAVPS